MEQSSYRELLTLVPSSPDLPLWALYLPAGGWELPPGGASQGALKQTVHMQPNRLVGVGDLDDVWLGY